MNLCANHNLSISILYIVFSDIEIGLKQHCLSSVSNHHFYPVTMGWSEFFKFGFNIQLFSVTFALSPFSLRNCTRYNQYQ